MPNVVPASGTPAVGAGDVRAIAKVGSTMVIGGTFTTVAGQARTNVAAFNASTNALTAFAPNVNGQVLSVSPGPTATSVYLGGSFTSVNGVAAPGLALLDLTTGAAVPGFTAPAIVGSVKDIVRSGSRLFIAGTFTKVGGRFHRGLAALNASTGAVDHSYLNLQLTGHHNDSGSGAQGAVGPWNIDITPDGTRMVVIGNFKYVDGILRDQVAQVDLGATGGTLANWQTDRYSPYCFSFAFDSYVRGVSYSPDGSFFVVASTGGGVTGTLCDAVARFETNAVGSGQEPTWVNESGGDTVWSVEVTDAAVFAGGHQRWANNPYGSDWAAPGAVPRPGLVALDPTSGRPLSWNPGRNPSGKAAYALLATSEGLWVGSNTEWIGNRSYRRPRLALFRWSGGVPVASTATGSVPGNLFYGGVPSSSASTSVLYRVNAGGGLVGSLDTGPDWSADVADPSPWRNSGSNAAGWSPVPSVDATVPATTPNAVFDSERWDPSGSPEMEWTFPVTAGTPVEVRLYLANRCSCTSGVGQRVFTTTLNGATWESGIDLVAQFGDQTGTMRSATFTVPSSGEIRIGFLHQVENPLVNAIEIVRTDLPPPPLPDNEALSRVSFSGTSGQPATTIPATGVNWELTRGSFMVGPTLFTAHTDGYLYRRTFNGASFGPSVKVDPYHDPVWQNVDNNLNGTYDGNLPSLYAQIPNLTGMFFSAGKLYYTLSGDSRLLWRWFSPDSGIVDERVFVATSSVNFNGTGGVVAAGSHIYVVNRTTGELYRADWSDGVVSGTPEVVGGPAHDGNNYRNRSFFLYSGTAINEPPTASFTGACTGATCAFDASDSADSDGTIASYAWTFGDGASGVGVSPSHSYAESGTYTVTLTVTDNAGATATKSDSFVVEVAPNLSPTAAFTATCPDARCTVDASASNDSDGVITSYEWDFGDGSTDVGVTASHVYSSSGTYTITLKVTDNRGGSDIITHDSVVDVPVSAIGFVGASHSAPGSTKFKSAVVPAGVGVGDTLVMFFTRPSASTFTGPTGVTGWTQIGHVATSTTLSTVWRKTVSAADLGQTVRFDDTLYRLGVLTLIAYRNVDPSAFVIASATDAGTSHVTPSVAAEARDWVVNYVAERSTSATGFTVPAPHETRDSLVDAGTARYSVIAVDRGTGVTASGPAPGATISGSGTGATGFLWSIAMHSQ